MAKSFEIGQRVWCIDFNAEEMEYVGEPFESKIVERGRLDDDKEGYFWRIESQKGQRVTFHEDLIALTKAGAYAIRAECIQMVIDYWQSELECAKRNADAQIEQASA